MRRRLLALLLAAVVGDPAAAATVADGRRALEERRYRDARAIWSDLARAGDVEARWQLALLLDLGLGGPRDPAAAFGWYVAAAQAGDARAELNAGVMLDSGRGTARDRAGAALWYARAAANGHARAAYDLAQLYESGEGVPRNPELARSWYRAAGLPAAAARAAGLADEPGGQGRRLAPAGGFDARVVPPAGPERGPAAELVWTAEAQPPGSRFFLEVLRLGGGRPEEVRAAYLDTSAALVPLTDRAAAYAWRVLTVAPRTGDYAAAPWQAFAAGASDPGRDFAALALLPRQARPLVRFELRPGDAAAARLAAELGVAFAAAGLDVEAAATPAARSEPVSSVRYAFAPDRGVAEAVATMLPALEGAAVLRAGPAPDGGPPRPGVVAVSLRFAPSRPSERGPRVTGGPE